MARRNPPKRANIVLNGLVKRHQLGSGLDRGGLALHWHELVGHRIAERTAPGQIRDGVLVVRVADSVWLNELTFLKGELLTKLKGILCGGIRDVRFVVGVVAPMPRPQPTQAADAGPPPITAEMRERAIRRAAGEIPELDDDELHGKIVAARAAQVEDED